MEVSPCACTLPRSSRICPYPSRSNSSASCSQQQLAGPQWSDPLSPHSHLPSCYVPLQIINTLNKVTNSKVFSLLPLRTLKNSPEDKNSSFVCAFPCQSLCLAQGALQLFCSPHVTSTVLSEVLPSSCFEVLINPISQLSYMHSLLLKN